MPTHIRTMHEDDAEAVSKLIRRSFQQCIADTYTERGIKHFMKITSKQAMLRRKRKNQLILVAESDAAIAGLVAVRNGNHLNLLFVAPEFHRRGIGTLLFQDALARMKTAIPDLSVVTVNSSAYALPFYTKLGFRAKSSAYFRKGMKITPMELLL
ncbi:MAG: GNAT family N-acetyltransferase [Spirochaetaceae bacterium]|nr:MAG: GNAT family N-acetyltransferase [Spirochaetaceae bacterium]